MIMHQHGSNSDSPERRETVTGQKREREKPTKKSSPELRLGAMPSDDQIDLISISRNSMITKVRESVGKHRARRDDLYFQLDPQRIEGASLN